MKKALSLLLSVLMLVSVFVMPVSAGADDGFNDGQFDWDAITALNVSGITAPVAGETRQEYDNRMLPLDSDPVMAACHYQWLELSQAEDAFVAGQTYTLELTYREEENDVAFADVVTVTVDAGLLTSATVADGVLTVTVAFEIPDVEVPDEPIEGTLENPIYVPMGQSAPTSLVLAAGQSVYYQLKAAVFNGYSIIARIPSAVTVDGTRYDAYSPADYGIRVPLEFNPMSPAIVGFHNETEEEMEISIDWEMPLGTETDPYQLENGDNAITIPVSYPVYYASYVPTAVGDYTLTASDFENFMITVDVDGDPATTEDQFKLTENYVFTCTESYIPVFFIVQPVGITPDVTLTVTPPAKGTENNPYWLSSYEEILAGVSGEGDATWPAGEGTYYNLDGAFNGTTLQVIGMGPLTVTVNGVSWSYTNPDVTMLDIQLELDENSYGFSVVIKSDDDVILNVVYPTGSMYNPQLLELGKNVLPLADTGELYYAGIIAPKDGVLVMTPASIKGLGYAEAVNSNTYESDFIYAGWVDDDGVVQGASEDNVLKVPVTEGDVVVLAANAGENEDFEILAMDLVLTVGYEGDSVVTITSESATANYAKMGAKVSAKVTAEGDGLTYTWYIKNEGSSKYSKSSVTSATYSTTMSAKAKNRRVYCVVTDQYGNSVQSKTFILRESVSLTKEPSAARYAKLGAKVSAKVSASGDGLKYTWYIKNAGKSSYSKSSVTSSTYSATMSSKVKGRKVYCIVTDKYGKKVQSKTFVLRESVSIVTQPKTVTVAKNKTAKVTVKASGDGLKYTWYVKNAGAKKYTKSSITKSSYSVTMTSKVKNRLVYCVVTDKYGKTVKSTTVKLKMK